MGWFYEENINREQSETKTIVIICQDSVEWHIIMVVLILLCSQFIS